MIIGYWIVKTLKKHFQTLNHSQNSHSFERDTPRDPYSILEVPRQASQDEIRKAYKAALAQYHPDKVNHLGEELKSLAQKKTQDIQWAYEQLKK